MIYVVATVELAEGKRAEFIAALQANVPSVLAEKGCIEYQPTIDLATDIGAQPDARPNVATVMEKWESIEALNAHLVAPHMLEYREKVKDLVAGVSLQILEPA
jgi:quinol monooxygenase YgiN